MRLLILSMLLTSCLAQSKTDELVRLAYGAALTAEEKTAKKQAASALNKLGLEKLRALLDNVHVPNMYIRFDMDSLVHRNRDKVGPILLDYVDSEHTRTRSYATYYLGFTPLEAEWVKIVPLLDHPDTATTAIRTLGKWRASNQVERISTFLDAENEKRRITAVNALRDIDDSAAVPAILQLLDDTQMTVRYVAERALTQLASTQQLIDALDTASPVAKRHLIHSLGDMKADTAMVYLESYAKSEQPGLRADAEEAIRKIQAPDESSP